MRRLHNRNLVDPISVGQTRPDRSDPSAAGSSLIENKYRRRRPRFDRLSSHKTNIFQENQQKKRKRRVSRRLCAVFLFFLRRHFLVAVVYPVAVAVVYQGRKVLVRPVGSERFGGPAKIGKKNSAKLKIRVTTRTNGRLSCGDADRFNSVCSI